MNMDERDGQTLSPRLLRSDRPALTLAPAGHVSLPESEFQAMLKELDELRSFKRATLAAGNRNPKMATLIREAARIFLLKPAVIVGPRRSAFVTDARLAIYVAGRKLGLDPAVIVLGLGRSADMCRWFARRSQDQLETSARFVSTAKVLEASCS